MAGITPATVNKSLAHLQRLGIVAELTERRRGRVFAYTAYVDLINAELAAPRTAPAGGRRTRAGRRAR